VKVRPHIPHYKNVAYRYFTGTADVRVAEVQHKLSSKIKELERDLADQRATNKVAQVALLGFIQQLAIGTGDPNPTLLARINAKFIELGGNTTPEENRRLVEATIAMDLGDLVTQLFDRVPPRILGA
jgi:hypothetical protein